MTHQMSYQKHLHVKLCHQYIVKVTTNYEYENYEQRKNKN